jgi:ubiquinone/menaquinone biosynthesis C-methylase UbiE
MLRRLLPYALSKRLFGDRRRFGIVRQKNDPDWREWESKWEEFYFKNQREGIGLRVNRAGYSIMQHLDLSGLRILEVGPGDIQHTEFWKSKPDTFYIADIRGNLLELAAKKLAGIGVAYSTIALGDDERATIPLPDESVDAIVTFYSLEHIHPIDSYLQELYRILTPGGFVVGAIPAEGGIAWGLGRFLTSRRWMKRNTSIDPDKIICWEHPNYCDRVIAQLRQFFEPEKIEYWPLRLPAADLNLVVRFIFAKRASGTRA